MLRGGEVKTRRVICRFGGSSGMGGSGGDSDVTMVGRVSGEYSVRGHLSDKGQGGSVTRACSFVRYRVIQEGGYVAIKFICKVRI